ncbi:MAG: 50S ribosomal protein L24 [Opitutaceae bacterium]
MKQKFHVKRGDLVAVISGSQKGKQGKVLEIRATKQRAVVEGVAMIKRHERKSQANPQGRIVEREGTVHVSNLKVVTAAEKPAAKKAGKAQS